jgi:hypothetical protein
MTRKEANKLALGVYRIFWKSGGSSVAAVGFDYKGNRWIAPCNWITLPVSVPDGTKAWRAVERVELIEAA